MTSDLVHFTDEESYGKFLDLHELHDIFCNLKGIEVGGACCYWLLNHLFHCHGYRGWTI